MLKHDRHAQGAEVDRDAGQTKFNPLESKYMAGAAVVGFLLMLLLSGGSLFAAFGALALIAGIGWVAKLLMHQGSG
jgi:hypothetical protein